MAATQLQLRNRIYSYLNDLQSLTAFTGQGDRYPAYVVNSVINDSVKHYVKILNSNYQGYLSTVYLLSVVAGVQEYALPASFRSPIYNVTRIINQTEWPLNPFEPYLFPVDLTPVPNQSWMPTFSLRANNIFFSSVPAENEANAVRIRFQGKVVEVTDVVPLPDDLYDMEDCVVLRTVVRLLQAKDVTGALKSITGWKEELRDAEAAFWMQVGNRYMKLERPVPVMYADDILY